MTDLWTTLIPIAIATTLMPVELTFTLLMLRSPGGRSRAGAWIAGKTVVWASGREFDQAHWTRDGIVIGVAGNAASVERAVRRLPD